MIFGLENSLTSFRMLIGGVANRMHPWWDEGANMIKLRTENLTGIFVDPKQQVWNFQVKIAFYEYYGQRKNIRLKQACTTYVPRAKCGPRKLFIWPA